MADRNPFLPVSETSDHSTTYTYLPDGDSPATTHRRQHSKKILLTVFSGLFLVLLYVALVDLNDNQTKNSIIQQDIQNVVPLTSTISEETAKPEILRPVSRGVAAGVSEKANLISSSPKTQAYPWNNSMLSWQRTAFHFQPEKNWMNDPNGPLFYKGWYHFFYQYNPNAAVWGDIVWGHAVSKDLIHWLHLPLAMVVDQWYDQGGVWTGSATILQDGKIVMLYTGSTNESVQVQNLAYPADHNDPLLLNWVKYAGNPVLVPPPGIKSLDFRDPTTAWLTSEGKWRFTIGSKVNRSGIALIYDTEDFINYELKSGILHGVDGTGMWECVDFYPVSETRASGLDTSVNGPQVKHVLKTSLDDDRHDYYALGSYDEKNVKWFPDNPEIDAGIGLRYDYGIFYASKTFYDQHKGRRVLWGWIGESDSESADVKKGWASLQGIPRTILLDTKTRTNLLQWPVEEIESLRLRSDEFNNIEVKPGSTVHLDIEAATQLDITAEFDLDTTVLENAAASNEEFSCRTSSGAAHRNALGPFGLLILADESLAEQTPVYFYVIKGNNGTLKTFFCTDQHRSSVANDVNKQIYGNIVPVLKGEKFSLRILVDHSIIESFAQGGRTCITSRVYPTRAIYGGAKLFLFNNAMMANVKASVKIWQMNSAFIRPYPNLRHTESDHFKPT
ncbi:acid beta-fructofuranosidase-like [Mercurialis annua]|uniref:acid beta-fructofuranosidase-like n=1 Tax=Mercurialis annua TaxID=3986 RepID=UPI00215E2306|nr:acid beta-fructofuranosidase-like [Mercurialis annua]